MSRKLVYSIVLVGVLMGVLGVSLNVHEVQAGGTITIKADGSVDPPTTPITTADNVTYTFTGNISDEIVVQRSNIIVDGNGYTLEGSGRPEGFYLAAMNNVTIRNTNIKGFGVGIWIVFGSHHNTISGNNITNNSYGILFNGIWDSGGPSNNNIISGNNITANYWYGIFIYSSSSHNTISGNNIRDSYKGIDLSSGSNNSIVGNNITNNWGQGIYLSSSSNNTFYHNNFIDNTEQVDSYNSKNVWDDGFEGNY
jgi:parallel beta-helix repeat protein